MGDPEDFIAISRKLKNDYKNSLQHTYLIPPYEFPSQNPMIIIVFYYLRR